MKVSLTLDRREFLGTVILAIGGAAVASMVPFARATEDSRGDWTIDDACGAYPPYAHPIPFGRSHAVSDYEGGLHAL